MLVVKITTHHNARTITFGHNNFTEGAPPLCWVYFGDGGGRIRYAHTCSFVNREEPLVALMALVPALHVSIKPQGWDK
ncbi:unannotated protein [freshwater metagenome]|uniref:Unannotated protein n=1 Tax=freshwater metagenome TaxID=449393 RepID=A0A6J6VW97_9ZZZZ